MVVGDAEIPVYLIYRCRPLSCKAGAFFAMQRANPVQGVRQSLTAFNLTGVGSFGSGDRPNRDKPFRRLGKSER